MSTFKPFTTCAFNKKPGESPIEVTDHGQLRRLLSANRMVDQGSDAWNYFGSDPKSVPTLQEIAKHGESGGDPKLAKLVKTVDPKVYTEVERQVLKTDFGRQSTQKGEAIL